MNGFTFPPPPPPPPARSSKLQEVSQLTGPELAREHPEAYRGQGAPRGRRIERGGHDHGFPQGLPRGAHFNPNFQPQSQRRPRDGHVDGRQGSTRASVSERQQHAPQIQTQSHPDRTAAGHKRKLDALRGPQLDSGSRSGPQVAPAVPRFGAPVISKDVNLTTTSSAPTTNTSGRSLFGIGNSHPELADSDSSNDEQEDDLDEEAMYAQLGTKLVFEYEGNVVSLANEADLAQWQQERKSRFPTIQRVAAKDAERRLIGTERKRLLDEAYALGRPSWARRPMNHGQLILPTTVDEQHVSSEAMGAAASSTVSISTDLLGMNQYGSDEEDDSKSEVVRGDDRRTASDGSGDEAPEEASSKPPIIDPRPACRYYFSTGACKAGDGCRFRHEPRVGQPLDNVQNAVKKQRPRVTRPDGSKKKGIYQLLTDQENEAADKLALQVIKHLGSIGFFEA
ncbi:hypothetical protein AMS68_002397 [Peltaster fructicola]|uniref:C3H1-type domain-containing protein n=1 Tax=Peltaster fructicola TaxID=286661 RepID=A0A6H0XQY5_9PEZI|nr:hypothetical protein AMS68_002397 [Peltaster fructicola]